MAEGTLIEWARHPVTGKGATWNIVTGCQIVSPGCSHCYAMQLAGTRLRNHPSRAGLTNPSKAGPVWNGQVRFNEQWLAQPLEWKAPHGIFVCAHGDLFAEGVTDDMLDQIFAVMALCPQHIFYVLTKRPERMRDYINRVDRESQHATIRRVVVALSSASLPTPQQFDWPMPNAWLGVSVEDQRRAEERIPVLLETPAARRFISAEPLLGLLDVDEWLHDSDCAEERKLRKKSTCFCWGREVPEARLDWVIAGGESGRQARESRAEWFRSLRDQCAEADVPFFFKQWGEFAPTSDANGSYMMRTGKKAAGRLLDGVEHSAFPEVA